MPAACTRACIAAGWAISAQHDATLDARPSSQHWMKAIGVALLLAVLVLAGCEDAPTGAPEAADSLAPEDDGCPNQEEIEAEMAVTDATNAADVDGDGSEDPVAILTAPDGGDGCRTFLVVELESGIASEPISVLGSEGGLGTPRVNSFVQIDGRGGVEIVIDEMAGASTQFVGAFTFVDGALERIEPANSVADIWSGASEGVFPYGGSVTHVEAADCSGEGEIVVSIALIGESRAETRKGIYEVTRRFFDVDGAELVEAGTETEKVEFDFGNSYPEFGSSPFRSCPTS